MIWLWLAIVLVATNVEAAAPTRSQGAYTEDICNNDADVFFCEDFDAPHVPGNPYLTNNGSSCSNQWLNPALGDQPFGNPWDMCFPDGGGHQRSTIDLLDFDPDTNYVWRIYKSGGATDIKTGVNSGTGGGTIAGFLDTSILGTGAREWYCRFNIYFHSTHTWPQDFDYKMPCWGLPREFEDPPSAEYEAGVYVHQDFFCSGLGNFNDVPAIRYSNNFGQFPYQNEYCPPLSPGTAANGTNAPRFQTARWYTVEMHYRLGTTSGTGLMEMWVDGNLAYSVARATCVSPCNDLGYVMILGWMNSADSQTGYAEIDNIVYSRAPIGIPTAGGDSTPPNPPTNLTIQQAMYGY